MKNKIKILFFGVPEFSAIVLEKMISANYIPAAVITSTDKTIGRKQVLTPPPIKQRIMNYKKEIKNKIKILQSDNVKNLKLEIINLQPDLIILTAYGQIIPKEILEVSKYGCLNVHPSLLPKYRGASPIQTAILNDDNETGITIMLMDEKLDHGSIIASQKLEIKNLKSEIPNKPKTIISKITYEELYNRLAEMGGKLLIETIPKWIKGEIKEQTQNHSKATFTKIIKKQDGQIDWQKSAQEIERMTRAYSEWPGVYTYLKIPKNKIFKILKIIKARVVETKNKEKLGKIFLIKNKVNDPRKKSELAVSCGQNVLILEEVQLEGKKQMTAQEFLNGYPKIIGTILK